MSKGLIKAVAVGLVAVGLFALVRGSTSVPAADRAEPIATVTYRCDGGKTIDARFYEGGTVAPSPGDPPLPGGSAVVSLDHGAETSLHQTVSADGVRYSNADESFVFWSKGNGAFVMRGDAVDPAYANCGSVPTSR